MKSLTISISDDVYQRAEQKAAAADSSLPKIVGDLLSDWTRGGAGPVGAAGEGQRRADFLKFLDALAARPLKPGPSVGRLDREELHQRGIPGY
jgi:hypothetical protein